MKFTPGPWVNINGVIYGESIGGCRLEHSKFMIAQVRGWGHLQYLENGSEIQDANAALIAAAPWMLEALQTAAAKFREYEDLHNAKGTLEGYAKAEINASLAEELEAVIARATGEAT